LVLSLCQDATFYGCWNEEMDHLQEDAHFLLGQEACIDANYDMFCTGFVTPPAAWAPLTLCH